MNYYAVVLYFDKESEAKMQDMMDKIVMKTGADFMKKEGIPPHITISALESEDEEALIRAADEAASKMREGEISFASIGIFNPLVIFLAPVMNDYLRNACANMNECVLRVAKVGNKGRYLPGQWVPHAALAVKLNTETIRTAFDIVSSEFIPFVAKAEKVVLARVEPYVELKTWVLKENS